MSIYVCSQPLLLWDFWDGSSFTVTNNIAQKGLTNLCCGISGQSLVVIIKSLVICVKCAEDLKDSSRMPTIISSCYSTHQNYTRADSSNNTSACMIFQNDKTHQHNKAPYHQLLQSVFIFKGVFQLIIPNVG